MTHKMINNNHSTQHKKSKRKWVLTLTLMLVGSGMPGFMSTVLPLNSLQNAAIWICRWKAFNGNRSNTIYTTICSVNHNQIQMVLMYKYIQQQKCSILFVASANRSAISSLRSLFHTWAFNVRDEVHCPLELLPASIQLFLQRGVPKPCGVPFSLEQPRRPDMTFAVDWVLKFKQQLCNRTDCIPAIWIE